MNIIKKILKNPFVSIFAIIVGVYVGLLYKSFSLSLKTVSDIFLLLLNMTVLPILLTSITCSVGRLISNSSKQIKLRKVLVYFFIAFVCVEIISLGMALLIKPGVISVESQKVLGNILMESESAVSESNIEMIGKEYMTIWEVIKKIIPSNIFNSLVQGNSIQILFTAIVLGIAAGIVEKDKKRFSISVSIIDLCDSFFKVFVEILNVIMLMLPFALFAMSAYQIANTGVEIIQAMARYVLCIYIISFIFIILCTIVISFKKNLSLFYVLGNMRECLFAAFASRSSFASMPIAISSLAKLKVNKNLVNLIIPLGSVIARFSMLIIYVSVLVFTQQLYSNAFNFIQIPQIFFLCIVASIAGIGSPAIVSLSLLSIVFIPLGLPYSSIVLLLLVIISIIDPILTAANVYLNCTVTVCLEGKKI